MSAARRRRRRNRVNTQLIGDTLQNLCINVVHEWSKLYSPKVKKKALFLIKNSNQERGKEIAISAKRGREYCRWGSGQSGLRCKPRLRGRSGRPCSGNRERGRPGGRASQA